MHYQTKWHRKKTAYKYVRLQGISKVQKEIETKQNLPKGNYQNIFKNH